jgi:hypothetical protein
MSWYACGMDKRLSKLSDEPSRKQLLLQPRDIQILELLDPEHRYAYLSRDWIIAFIGGSTEVLRHRLGQMSRKPYKWLHRPDQQRAYNVLYKQSIYMRGEGGDALLMNLGKLSRRSRRRSAQFRHELLLDFVDASIELGARRDPMMEYLDWSAILAHPKTPQSLLENTDPFKIQTQEQALVPDGRPFVLRHTQKGAIAFFKEVDCNNEQIAYTPKKHNTLEHKFRRYKDMFGRKLYQFQYGFPAAMVLVVTTNQVHMQNMMRAAERALGKPSWLLFKYTPDHDLLGKSIPVTTEFYDTPWERAGRPPFLLNTMEPVQ